MTAARAWVAARLADEYGLSTGETWDLGGPYRPSPGPTPETIYPWTVEVRGVAAGKRPLQWARLAEVIARRAELPNGHLRVVALRAAHALGVPPASRDGR